MDLFQAIQRFTVGRDDANDGFEVVGKHIQKFLQHYLHSYLPLKPDRDDAISAVILKIWSKRQQLLFETEGAWWAYVAKAGRNAAIDHTRLPSAAPAEALDEVPLEEEPVINRLATTELRDRIFSAADELWLGADPAASPLQRKTRLLALQLWLLHRQSTDEICALLGDLGRVEDVKRWVDDTSTHRQLFYADLYRPNDALAGYLLRPCQPLLPNELQEIGREAGEKSGPSSLPGWSWQEVRVIVLRYRNGLSLEKVLQMSPTFAQEEVEATIAKCRDRLPFRPKAQELLAALIAAGWDKSPLSEGTLYRRLAFQYWMTDELPQKQIMERVEAPAEVGCFKLTEGMLNVWLSNERLLKQLVAYIGRGRDA